jgi:hypothetical protein
MPLFHVNLQGFFTGFGEKGRQIGNFYAVYTGFYTSYTIDSQNAVFTESKKRLAKAIT